MRSASILFESDAPTFADIKQGLLRLLLSGPKSAAGRVMGNGDCPGPDGWNRIHLAADDLGAEQDLFTQARQGRTDREPA